MKPQELKKLEESVLKTLQTYLKKNDTVILGLSGGPDSVFLLHMLEKLPLKIIIAHLNHQIRPKDSKRDQAFVEKLATNHTFALQTKDVKKLATKSKANLEETGRNLRYKLFEKLHKKHQAKYILTGHHADDDIETVILNLTRGASLQGLSGMQMVRGHLLRPLLNITKSEITNYLKTKKIKYYKDSTNKDLTLGRNFIRKKVIPNLKKLNPNIAKTIGRNTQNIREIQDYLNQQSKKWIQKNKAKTAHSYNATTFKKLKPALQKNILMQIYQNIIGNTKGVEITHIEEFLQIVNHNIGNKKKKIKKLTFTFRNHKIKVDIEK